MRRIVRGALCGLAVALLVGCKDTKPTEPASPPPKGVEKGGTPGKGPPAPPPLPAPPPVPGKG